MMCERTGYSGAKTGSVSATFTFSVQGNATLSSSSHFFITLGQLWLLWGKEMERKGSKGGINGGVKRARLLFHTASSPKNYLTTLQRTFCTQMWTLILSSNS